jgi:hypothetical protein
MAVVTIVISDGGEEGEVTLKTDSVPPYDERKATWAQIIALAAVQAITAEVRRLTDLSKKEKNAR